MYPKEGRDRIGTHVRRRAGQGSIKAHQRRRDGDDDERDAQGRVCQHDTDIGSLQANAAVEEVHPSGRDDQRDDHRRNQDRHDRAAKRHVLLAEADGGERPEADREQCRGGGDLDRGPDGTLPCRAVEEVLVVAQRIAFGIKTQHFRREGKEVFGVETEWHDHEDRCDQEDKDRATDDAEGKVPKHLTGGQIGGDLGAVASLVKPEAEPAEEPAEDDPEHQHGDTAKDKPDDGE